ncbi:MAG: hypothetical protein RLZZ350_2375 [Verrucomicrobiota bacterium]|jgi:hypothetical protein
MKRRAIIYTALVLLLAATGWFVKRQLYADAWTIEERLAQFGPTSRARLQTWFAQAGLTYPPAQLMFVGLKAERLLQIYAPASDGRWRFVHACAILGASGVAGPKLREGDFQVPEGIYAIDLLNPNSRYQISMQVSYPNTFDREHAAAEGRRELGGEIMIHGGHTSAGCLAVGDEASADLFVLAADTGLSNITVVLAPVDFRAGKSVTNAMPAWTPALYDQIKMRLTELPLPPNN